MISPENQKKLERIESIIATVENGDEQKEMRLKLLGPIKFGEIEKWLAVNKEEYNLRLLMLG